MFMKSYQKAELMAKNLPSGSYAAGCPSMDQWAGHKKNLCLIDAGNPYCQQCERTY